MIQAIKIKTNDGLRNYLCSVSSELDAGLVQQLQNNSYPFIFQQEILFELLASIHKQSQGFTIVIDVINDLQLSQLTRNTKHFKSLLDSLTKREKAVLELISKGYHNSKIAAELCISNETVKSHRKNILLRTGCKGFDEIKEMLRQIENYEFLFT